ncbi:enoyl-CoA hydratase/isomerase family protein [Neomicrococcus lactis]|uniref:3-hydroxyisobutyryl-CoA hydrolase n=1 Tax=Neomicrococcus lactis TaxID=732241 RepID=A0A7W9DBY3_9MICC|nr:enoyl-CoA hydratase/isomerase family protein [Neomicrococcus lactis]MBB5599150.1 enoyl-CoA hydratase [Neomicrococcus lactis]
MSTLINTAIVEGIGVLTLNRPEKLNALNLEMIKAIAEVLDEWANHPEVKLLLLQGAGDRGFCAGGDVRSFYDSLTKGAADQMLGFLSAEYNVNRTIANFPKPVIAYMDGMCMGGGVGLAGHANIRIVTERSKVAMPETRIGLTPDVGGTHLLGHAPGRAGEYLGLTSSTMGPGDAIYAGFADMMISSENYDDVISTLPDLSGLPAADLLAALEVMFGSSPTAAAKTGKALPEVLEANQQWIDRAFSQDDVESIMAALEDMPGEGPRAALEEMKTHSYLSQECALKCIRAARDGNNLSQALEREYNMVKYVISFPDFTEGVRAQLVDKDRNPQWTVKGPEDLNLAEIERVAHDVPDVA